MKQTKNIAVKTRALAEMFRCNEMLLDVLERTDVDKPFQIVLDYDPKQSDATVKKYYFTTQKEKMMEPVKSIALQTEILAYALQSNKILFDMLKLSDVDELFQIVLDYDPEQLNATIKKYYPMEEVENDKRE